MSYAWSWDDVPDLPAANRASSATAARRKPIVHGGTKRPHGAGLSRFLGTSSHADREGAALSPSHPAVAGNRTLFPTTVVSAAAAPRVLVSGMNSAKIGRVVRKGGWRGLPIFTLTLEERATCPESCTLLRECYGNAMPFSRRVRPDVALLEALNEELEELLDRNRRGIVVRLHVLGDFFSVPYVDAWAEWMERHRRLHVFGYTAHEAGSEMGRSVADLCFRFPDRWMVRFSVAPEAPIAPMQATTIWRQPEAATVPEGLVCPAQTKRTAACATCGLCWSPAAAGKRIVFVGHGMRRRGR